jgi:hypothetical protein
MHATGSMIWITGKDLVVDSTHKVTGSECADLSPTAMSVILTSPPTVISALSVFDENLGLNHDRTPSPSMYLISVVRLRRTADSEFLHSSTGWYNETGRSVVDDVWTHVVFSLVAIVVV